MDTNNKQPKPKEVGNSILKNIFTEQLPKYFLGLATILMFIVFSILEPKFLSGDNMLSILVTASLSGTLAIGMLFALIVGEMNFAIGAQATVAAAIVGFLMSIVGFPYPIAILCGLAFPLLIGIIGIGINIKIGVPTFIATLALSPFADGLTKIFTQNKVYYSDVWPETPFGAIGSNMVGPIPLLVIVFFLLVIAVWVLLDHTRFGRYMFAVGTNRTASMQVGINVTRIKVIGFLLSSAIVAFGGMILASREFKVWPTMGGEHMMQAIAIAMLSATFFRPGRFNIQGVFVASFFITAIYVGIRMVGAPLEIRYVVQGVAFILAVGFIARTRKGGLPAVQFGR
jgi:ribose/xylose/arabinose/galactoside ABC-type transport system permease subunit